MRIEQHEDTLRVLGLRELDSANAAVVHEAILKVATDTVRHIEVDLSGAVFLDSCGLGTLLALRKLVAPRCGVVRLLDPGPAAQQFLGLTRLYRVLEVVRCEEVPDSSN